MPIFQTSFLVKASPIIDVEKRKSISPVNGGFLKRKKPGYLVSPGFAKKGPGFPAKKFLANIDATTEVAFTTNAKIGKVFHANAFNRGAISEYLATSPGIPSQLDGF
jgi:hypothetical protein